MQKCKRMTLWCIAFDEEPSLDHSELNNLNGGEDNNSHNATLLPSKEEMLCI